MKVKNHYIYDNKIIPCFAFVNRENGLSIEWVSEDEDVEIEELVSSNCACGNPSFSTLRG